MNASAALIWGLADGEKSESEIAGYIRTHISVGINSVTNDVASCIDQLSDLNILWRTEAVSSQHVDKADSLLADVSECDHALQHTANNVPYQGAQLNHLDIVVISLEQALQRRERINRQMTDLELVFELSFLVRFKVTMLLKTI